MAVNGDGRRSTLSMSRSGVPQSVRPVPGDVGGLAGSVDVAADPGTTLFV